MAIGDQVGKAAADEFAAQIPGLKDFIASQLAELQTTVKQIVANASTELNTVVGSALADVTFERTEAIKQAEDAIHGILDRVNLPQLIGPRKTT